MMDKLQAFNQARKMKAEMDKELEQIFHQEEKGDNLVLVRGDKRIERIVINGEERKEIKDLINEAMKGVDKKVEKKMRDRAGDLMSMLGM